MGLSEEEPPANAELAALLAVLGRAGVPVALLDHRCVVTEANAAFALACGRPSGELVGADLTDSVMDDDRAAVRAMIGEVADGAAPEGTVDHHPGVEARIVGADGRVRAMRLHLGFLDPVSRQGSPRVLCVAHDRSTERRRDRSDRAARVKDATVDTTDALTGLPNRRGLDMALASAARRSRNNDSPFALLRCEVDWPDHDDPADEPRTQALVACVDRVRQRLRPADTVARISPELLMVVAEDLHDEQDAAGVAYRLLSTVVEPVATESGPATLRMVVGVAMADGATPPHALAAATAEAANDAREPGGFKLMDLRGLGG